MDGVGGGGGIMNRTERKQRGEKGGTFERTRKVWPLVRRRAQRLGQL